MAMSNLRLEFAFNAPVPIGSDKLEPAKLILIRGESKIAYSATSGLQGYQAIASARVKGRGRIPACSQVGITYYQVVTMPIFLPNTKGVEGFFFPIQPFSVRVGGHHRGDFGIHFDANVPGSAGCVVIKDKGHWIAFQEAMREVRDKAVNTLPLYVT